MTHFPRHSKSHPYSVITPDTPLEELEAFFRDKNVDFALGEPFHIIPREDDAHGSDGR